MVEGSFEALASNPNGLVIGRQLADKMGVGLGDSVTAVTTAGTQTSLKIVGIFHTGIDAEDQYWGIVPLARQQAMQNRPRVVNEIHVRLADVSRSIPLAQAIERRWGFKSAPWEETYARVLDVFALQDKIMFLTTASILVVAGFGIFNVISTIVLEKARDIAIMRSIGMPQRQRRGDFRHRGDRRRGRRHDARLAGRLGARRAPAHGPGADRQRRRPAPGQADALSCSPRPASSRFSRRSGRRGCRRARPPAPIRCRSSAAPHEPGARGPRAHPHPARAAADHARRRRRREFRGEELHRRHRSVRLGQVVASLPARPARSADLGRRAGQRRIDAALRQRGARADAARTCSASSSSSISCCRSSA